MCKPIVLHALRQRVDRATAAGGSRFEFCELAGVSLACLLR